MLDNVNVNEKAHIFTAVHYIKFALKVGWTIVDKKPKTNTLDKGGVYQLICMQCGILYIRQ